MSPMQIENHVLQRQSPCMPAGPACALFTLQLSLALCCLADPSPPPIPDTPLLRTKAVVVDGDSFIVSDGNAYKLDRARGLWTFSRNLYDPLFFARNYTVRNDRVFRIDESSRRRYEMTKSLRAGFEDVASLKDLIDEKHRFTSIVLLSPKAPTIAEYVRLRKTILQGQSTFVDNRIEPSSEQAHSGKQSLRCFSVAKAADMVCAKAHIESEYLHFVKGDNYWFSGWFFLASGMPYTIVDIKSSWIQDTPGLRLVLESGEPQFELKWADKPRSRQSVEPRAKFPVGRWVPVRIHLTLSDQEDGMNELWLDGRQLIKTTGRNLPLADTVYNHFEVGITATHGDAVVFVDDVEVSGTELP